MKKVDFNKLQAGDLVKVPRTQFAPMRSGWNGWLFSEAVVIRKGVGRKSKRNVVVVEMRTPAGKNNYGTIEATFYAENVFTTPAANNARNIDTVGVAEFFALLYIAYEVVSIFKNMALCGLPVKKVWEKVREFLAKYTDELPDTDELDGDSTTGNVEEHRTQER